MKKMMLLISIVGLGLFFNGICMADTIYVDQSGGGDHITIEAGINAAYPGDTVKVGPGSYYEQIVIDKDIELIGSGPNFTTINASNETGDTVTFTSNQTPVISSFTITGNGNGITLISKGIVKNCVITGCGKSGIYIHSSPSFDIAVINCTIVFNMSDGVYVYHNGTVNLTGNIIGLNGRYGIWTQNNKYHTITKDFQYNNVFNNNKGNLYECLEGTGYISQNPKFIDQEAGNYALRSDSPCRDTGKPGAEYNDPDGTRSDMGAYGGPASASYWPYTEGPSVTEISVMPASVPKGGKITIKAKARVR